MKLRKSIVGLRHISVLVAMIFIFLASCQKDNSILSSTDTQNVNAESASSSYVSEISDMSTTAVGGVSTTQYAGGRVEAEPVTGLALIDDRFKCATVTITRTGTKLHPVGTITITFDGTCADKRGIKRSGNIVITYNGRRWMPGSYWTIQFVNFYRNDTHIEGKDSVTTQISSDSLHLQFQSILTGGQITFGDGKTMTRDHNLIREWFRAPLPINDEWHTLKGGTASGKCKDGDTYQMQITKDLIHKVACLEDKVFIPVSGTKVITVTKSNTTEQYTVDYGDGTCDNNITVTLNGKEKTITVNGEGD
jgi:hypothetical protein